MTPLLLLHGVGMSARAWDPVRGILAAEHRVLAPTMAGHRGGTPWPAHEPVGVSGLVDDVEAYLDGCGVASAHVAGNSLGGWVALELARRGRAESVVALSPAGGWGSGADLRRMVWSFRVSGVLARSRGLRRAATYPAARRLLLRRVMEHGERVADVGGMFADLEGCPILEPLLDGAAAHGGLRPFATLPCPVRIAWSARDHVVPWARHGAPLRARLPGAEFVSLPGVGHVPMGDDPAGVGDAILGVTRVLDRKKQPA